MDQKELLNQIINHKMLRKMFEVECGKAGNDFHVFSRSQIHEITAEQNNPLTGLMLMAISTQIAEEEEMFLNMK